MADDQIFSCRMEGARSFLELLSCLLEPGARDHTCCFDATRENLAILVTGKSKSTQARVSLEADVFDEYSCESDSVQFSVNLVVLLNCLSIHAQASDGTMVKLFYSSEEAILKVSLEEGGILTVCEINTVEPDDDSSLNFFATFRQSPETSQLILKSDVFRESIQDLLDASDITSVALRMTKTNEEDSLKLVSFGGYCSCEVVFPKACAVYVSYRCDSSCEWYFAAAVFQSGMKALSVSKEAFLRVSQNGMMCVQHQIPTANNKVTYLDFLMIPSEQDMVT